MATGYDGDILTYYDSTTGQNVTVDTSGMSFAEKMAIKNDNNLGYFTNVQGERVYGTRPAATYQEPTQGDIIEGYDPAPLPSNYSLPGEEHLVPEVVQPPKQVYIPPYEQPGAGTPPVQPPVQPPQAGLPPGTGTQPPPTGDGSTVPWTPELSGDGATWNWDYFQAKSPGAGEWGGYDQDYGVFERYQPGQDSPWGMPDIEGGNKEFYQQQFNNLLRDEQGFQTRERAAQLRRQEAQDNPAAPINFDDMWASMDFEPAVASTGPGGGDDPWRLSTGARGDTNQQLFSGLGDIWNPDESDAWATHFSGDTNPDSKYWGSFDNPTDFMNQWKTNNPGAEGAWTDINQKLANNLWTQQVAGASNVPAGYASPV